MRAVVQSGIRPLVMRLYDPEDTAFNGYESPRAMRAGRRDSRTRPDREGRGGRDEELAARATDSRGGPWSTGTAIRFSLSGGPLEGPSSGRRAPTWTRSSWPPVWSVLTSFTRGKSAIAIGGLALCHFSHAYEQGCCAYFSFGGSADTRSGGPCPVRPRMGGSDARGDRAGSDRISHHHGMGQARARWVADEMGGGCASGGRSRKGSTGQE